MSGEKLYILFFGTFEKRQHLVSGSLPTASLVLLRFSKSESVSENRIYSFGLGHHVGIGGII